MDLIKLNGYVPPAPTTYDVDFSDVNGEESQVEDGTTYVEQIRADVPEISIGWTNITETQVNNILDSVNSEIIYVSFYYGLMYNVNMRKSNRSLKLKSIDESGTSYWNLSFTLKG